MDYNENYTEKQPDKRNKITNMIASNTQVACAINLTRATVLETQAPKIDKETQTDENEDDYINTIKEEVKEVEPESSSSSSSSDVFSVKELSEIPEDYEEEKENMDLEAQDIPFEILTQIPINE